MRVGQRVVGEPFRSTDCHSQCAHWLRNDGLFARGTVGHRDTWVPPYRALFCRGGRPTLSARLGAFLVVRRGGALPLPRATARVAPTDGNKERGKAGRRGRRPLRRGTRSAVWRAGQLRAQAVESDIDMIFREGETLGNVGHAVKIPVAADKNSRRQHLSCSATICFY